MSWGSPRPSWPVAGYGAGWRPWPGPSTSSAGRPPPSCWPPSGWPASPPAARSSAVLVAQLDRLLAGLDDLEAARTGRRPAGHRDVVDLREYTRSTLAAWEGSVQASVDWRPGPERVAVDRGRLAQALGNLIANAAEHGAGEVRIEGRRGASGLRLEVSNAHRPDAGSAGRPARGRGRGLRIAAGAARDLGGRLRVESGERATLAVLELPDEAAARSRDRAA